MSELIDPMGILEGVSAAVASDANTAANDQEAAPASRYNVTPADVHIAERRRRRHYATHEADPRYRQLQDICYADWDGFNQNDFDGQLTEPHIAFGRTAGRRLSHCNPTTSYGGYVEIILNDGIVFGTSRHVINPLPAEGTRLYLRDHLRRETVRQYVLEVQKDEETGYRGYGPRFAAEANRIGAREGLPRVVARRRGERHAGQHVACNWPFHGRSAGYYLGDVVPFAIPAVAPTRPRQLLGHHVSIDEYYLTLLALGRGDRLREILERRVDNAREEVSPALRLVEEGTIDNLGNSLPPVQVEPSWLCWQNSCVRKIAEAILQWRSFGDMPILADALEDAGCTSEPILAHCRLQADHTHRCFVLKALLQTASVS
jgi:hypothetical protein